MGHIVLAMIDVFRAKARVPNFSKGAAGHPAPCSWQRSLRSPTCRRASGQDSKGQSFALIKVRTARLAAPASFSTRPLVLYEDPVVKVVISPLSKVHRRIGAEVSSRARSQWMRCSGNPRYIEVHRDPCQSRHHVLHSS